MDSSGPSISHDRRLSQAHSAMAMIPAAPSFATFSAGERSTFCQMTLRDSGTGHRERLDILAPDSDATLPILPHDPIKPGPGE